MLALAAPTQGRSAQAPALRVDPERSVLVARLKRAGLMRFLGHEHGIVPGSWSAEVRFDPDDLAGSRFAVEIPVAELIIDSADARRLADVDPDGPDSEERGEIRADMLSGKVLDGETFPIISFESRQLTMRSGNRLQIAGTLTLHGVSRDAEVDATLLRDGPGYLLQGRFEIGLRDFGIEPVSVAGGMVKVADEVEIRFDVYAANGARD